MIDENMVEKSVETRKKFLTNRNMVEKSVETKFLKNRFKSANRSKSWVKIGRKSIQKF